jgi:hypothetical protein
MKNIVLPIIAAGVLLLAGASVVRHLPQRELTEAPSPPPESPFSERVAPNAWTRASYKSSTAFSPTDSLSTSASKWTSSLRPRLFPTEALESRSRSRGLLGPDKSRKPSPARDRRSWASRRRAGSFPRHAWQRPRSGDCHYILFWLPLLRDASRTSQLL